jgi:hypothetical protein
MEKFNIESIVKKVLEESLQEKTDYLVNKIKSRISEEPETAPNPEGCKKIKEIIADGGEDTLGKLEEYCGKSEMGEGLYGNQKRLDKNKNNKIDSEDFKMLRGENEEELDEINTKDLIRGKKYRYKTPSTETDIEFDTEHEYPEGEDNMYGFRNNNSGYNAMSRKGVEDFIFDLDDEELGEGNAFTGALSNAKKSGKDSFEVDGKKYSVKESDSKFIQKAEKEIEKKGTKGDFAKHCGGEVTKSCIDKALKSGNPKLVKQAYFAKNIKGYKGAEHKKKTVKESFRLTENELIDLIERIVLEDKKAKGMAETEKVLSTNKKENEEAIKAVTKKMKEYLKMGHEGEYETNPEQFPLGNGQIKKMQTMKYNPSEAVDEYIEAFAYPGMTNLVFDEIKPDDKKIDKYLKGDSTTGNAVKDKQGKALGNVVPSKVGDRFKKNYDENLYGQEQMNASYKRQPQPVDQAGETTQRGSLKSKKGKKTAQSVLNAVEESTTKQQTKLNETFDKMKHLIDYNKKTQ